MAKKKSWFNLVKRFLFSETKLRTEKKDKRRRWVFERIRIKKFASISAPLASKEKILVEAEKEHSKHALSLAIASAAAAEAAVAAAHVAAEVVRLTATAQSTLQLETEDDLSVNKNGPDTPPSTPQSEREILLYAAIKIQTAFRSYLARKALRALKGIVKLQAIIRGRAVRRQAMTTLKCLQSIVNIQSKVCAQRSFQLVEGTCHCDDETKHLQILRDEIIRMDSNSQRRWDDSILSKEEAEALYLSKKEAAIKRERIKEYSFTHRNSAESDRNKVSGRWRYWLEQWVDTQLSKSKEFEDLDSKYTSNPSPREEYQGKQPKLKIFQKQCHNIEGLDSPIFVPRRSSHHHKRQCSLGDDNNSFSASPAVPTYMAATESARAKARSMSSPKLRTGSFDAYSDSYSPYKNKLCLISSVSSKVPSSAGRTGKPSGQRSPSLKGIPGAVKSISRVPKDLSFDSECSLANWDRYSAFR